MDACPADIDGLAIDAPPPELRLPLCPADALPEEVAENCGAGRTAAEPDFVTC